MSSNRRYHSAVRAETAQLTRRRILAAAQEQLYANGFHGTTVGSLAKAAAVSPQTIYNSIGNKAAVVKALYDILLAGDEEPIVMSQRPEFLRVRDQPSAAEVLRAYAAMSKLIYSRVGKLLGALLAEGAGADVDLDAFMSTIERERRIGNTQVVTHIANTFGLPSGIPVDRAVDMVWTCTSYEVADRLIRRCGWDVDAYEIWLGDVIVASLCGLGDQRAPTAKER